MDETAEKVGGRAKVVKINVDDNGPLGPRFGVRSIPTLLIFKNGQVVEEISGGSNLTKKLLAHSS